MQLVNSLLFAGCFVGSGVFGALADRLGRRLPLAIATAVVAAATLASLAAPSYWWMAAARAATGFGAAGQSQAIFLLCTEATGPLYRGIAGISSTLFFAGGEFLLLGLAYALPNWRHLTLTAGLLNAAALLLLPAVPESARWLLAKGRVSEATALLRRMARANGSSMPTVPLIARHGSGISRTSSAASSEAWTDDASASSSDDGGEQPAGLLTLLCQPSLLVRTLVLLLTWFSLLLVSLLGGVQHHADMPAPEHAQHARALLTTCMHAHTILAPLCLAGLLWHCTWQRRPARQHVSTTPAARA